MIPTPFRFLEVEEEKLAAHAAQLDEAKLGIAPKALDPVDMVFPTGELIFMMVNAMVLVPAQDQSVVRLPAVGVDGGFGKHPAPDDRLQLCLGAVLHHAGEDPAAAFEQADDGRLAT